MRKREHFFGNKSGVGKGVFKAKTRKAIQCEPRTAFCTHMELHCSKTRHDQYHSHMSFMSICNYKLQKFEIIYIGKTRTLRHHH